MALILRPLRSEDISEVAGAFAELGWAGKDAAQYERYLTDQEAGKRATRFAFVDGVFAGYVTVLWQSSYPLFAADHIPEIVDLNVLPRFRRQGNGTALMDEVEREIAARSPIAGIGVGMTEDYGSALRLYVRRGYMPDGRGLTTHGRFVVHGERVVVDDGLVLYFRKTL